MTNTHALSIQIVGNELHTLLHCPHSSHLSHPAILSFTRALRRFDLCSWSSHTPLQQTEIKSTKSAGKVKDGRMGEVRRVGTV